MNDTAQRLVIEGGRRLSGEITLQGAKNSALPILAATLVARGQSVLHNCPRLCDINCALRILTHLGCKCKRQGDSVLVDSTDVTNSVISQSLMRKMRSSIVFLGAVVSRAGECSLSLPGGCELGPRPIDMHLFALRKMGVKISENYPEITCKTQGGIKGAGILLPFPSVGATENIILAACTARGQTVIKNAAREPEIVDLATFLRKCGAKITGDGTSTVIVDGVEALHSCEHTIMPDRIAAATFMSSAAITNGEVTIKNTAPSDLESISEVFELMGCKVHSYNDTLYLSSKKPLMAVKSIKTMPYPAFPTDAQAIVAAPLCIAQGTSVIVENIFESRFGYASELVRMGADIKTQGKIAIIEGVRRLNAASLYATDLRGGAAMVIAALAASGKSEIYDIFHIDRGYDSIENTLSSMGALIKRESL